MTLLDTCVISELSRAEGNPRVHEAVEASDSAQLYLSVVTVGELEKGVALLPSGRKQTHLRQWLLDLQQQFQAQIIPIDIETARVWGELTARAQNQGIQIPMADGLIAATAVRHGMHVMTRNTRHFAASGVLVIDPWE
jgi:toxin FitB